jgi:hypothetical protein
LSWWFTKKQPYKKNQPKRPSQNSWIEIDLSKMAFWSSWKWGQKNHMGGFFFLPKFPIKKIVISSSDLKKFRM